MFVASRPSFNRLIIALRMKQNDVRSSFLPLLLTGCQLLTVLGKLVFSSLLLAHAVTGRFSRFSRPAPPPHACSENNNSFLRPTTRKIEEIMLRTDFHLSIASAQILSFPSVGRPTDFHRD